MTKPILLGWDASEGAKTALRWAAEEACFRKLPLRVALVLPQPEPTLGLMSGAILPPLADEEIADLLTPVPELVAAVAPDVDVETVTLSGHPVGALIEAAKEAELLVVGSRGHGAFLSHLVGSISTSVGCHSDVPVVVVRGTASTDPKAPVVVGADGSKISAKAVRFAARYADQHQVPLVAVCALPDATQMIAPEVIITPEFHDELTAEAERFLHESMSGLAEEFPNLEIRQEVSQLPATAALTQAGEGARLVVVGSHGRGGFAGMLLGSVSRAVLFHAPCPIAVVRCPKG